uniref:Uncharacterized protein n=1 Tax=Siphoviridae sp. ctrpg19 TaxID=2826481 RepID=A0A8S5MK97_9CAUD|nr:MAG TPA: hypothetical protein [Siphoviridae sp. ctrpg19]
MILYVLCIIFAIIGGVSDISTLINPEKLQDEDGNMPTDKQICISIIISWIIDLGLLSYGIYNLVM